MLVMHCYFKDYSEGFCVQLPSMDKKIFKDNVYVIDVEITLIN